MKILIFNFEYPPLGGGGGVATRDIAETLGQRHDVTIITTHWGNLKKYEKQGRVEVWRVPVVGRKALPTATIISLLAFAPAAWWFGEKLMRKEKFDVINAQFAVPSGIPAVLIARRHKLPLVVSLVGGDLYDPTKGLSPHRHWWLRAAVRWAAESADICTAISSDTRRRAIDTYGITKEIVVTHLGVRPQEKTRKGKSAEEKKEMIMVTIGRLIPRKGYEVLLRAMKLVAKGKLVIMGSGPMEAKIRQIIDREGLQERVELAGQVTEEKKQELLEQADIYISASEHEGFGIVYLEAMLWALPVVATDNGGQMDFLDEKGAMIVGAGDYDGLARAASKLIADGKLRRVMGEYNKNQVKNFYLEETTKRFEEVLVRAYQNKV